MNKQQLIEAALKKLNVQREHVLESGVVAPNVVVVLISGKKYVLSIDELVDEFEPKPVRPARRKRGEA